MDTHIRRLVGRHVYDRAERDAETDQHTDANGAQHAGLQGGHGCLLHEQGGLFAGRALADPEP